MSQTVSTLLPRATPERPTARPKFQQWAPAIGPSVDYALIPADSSRLHHVYAADQYLGDVFQDERSFYRFRRAGSDELRGSRLRNRVEAAAALLAQLRGEGLL